MHINYLLEGLCGDGDTYSLLQMASRKGSRASSAITLMAPCGHVAGYSLVNGHEGPGSESVLCSPYFCPHLTHVLEVVYTQPCMM
jgi:hypothetical protein